MITIVKELKTIVEITFKDTDCDRLDKSTKWLIFYSNQLYWYFHKSKSYMKCSIWSMNDPGIAWKLQI